MHACTPVSPWPRIWSRTASRRHSAAQTPGSTQGAGTPSESGHVRRGSAALLCHPHVLCVWVFQLPVVVAHLLRSRELRAEGRAVHRAAAQAAIAIVDALDASSYYLLL